MESTLESIELQVMPLIATGSAEGMRRGEVTVAVFDDVAVLAETSSFAAVSGGWQEASIWATWLPGGSSPAGRACRWHDGRCFDVSVSCSRRGR